MKKTGLVFALIFLVAFLAQGQEKSTEVKIDRKVEIRNEGESVKLKVIENGNTVVDKTYDSIEDLKNDPALKEYNVMVDASHFGEEGGRKIIFKDKDGNVTELDGKSFGTWSDSGKTADFEVFFNSEDGEHFNVTKDDEGNIVIKKNGTVLDINAINVIKSDANVKVKKLDDGSLQITDENGTRTITEDEMNNGDFIFFSEGSGNEEGFKEIKIETEDGDREGNFILKLNGDNSWVSDGLHEEGNQVIFQSEEIRSNGDGHVIIKMEKGTGEEGEIVKVVIKRIHIVISDLDNLHVVEEIPGSNVVSNKILQLEEVNYYPNPNTGVFNLQFAGKQLPTQIRVINMMGKEVYSENLQGFKGLYDKSIDLSGSDKGMYILQILQGEKSWNKKLVIE